MNFSFVFFFILNSKEDDKRFRSFVIPVSFLFEVHFYRTTCNGYFIVF